MQLGLKPDYTEPFFTFKDVRRVEHDGNSGDETVWEEMVGMPNWKHDFKDLRRAEHFCTYTQLRGVGLRYYWV